MLPIRTILHPNDFSEYSNYAFRLACSLAKDYHAKLIVLHVAEPPPVVATEVMPIAPLEIDLGALEKELRELKPKEASINIEYKVIQGTPMTEILSEADHSKADLILLGTHGRSGIGRLLMGSVAEQIVRKAHCPVLTVKSPMK